MPTADRPETSPSAPYVRGQEGLLPAGLCLSAFLHELHCHSSHVAGFLHLAHHYRDAPDKLAEHLATAMQSADAMFALLEESRTYFPEET